MLYNQLALRTKPVILGVLLLTSKIDRTYQFSVGDQLKRSSLSVLLNIVESGARKHPKEKDQLLNIAFGSLKETLVLLDLLKDLQPTLESTHVLVALDEIAKILYTLVYKNHS